MAIRKPDAGFKCFSPNTINFLRDLRENNDKRWFDLHKSEYDEHLLSPLRAFVGAIGQRMLMIDPLFEVTPAVGKTISRIYRDARFSKNKSPFKTAMWCTFKRPRADWKDTPAFFFEVAPDFYRYGMGFFEPERATMERFRDYIFYDTVNFQKASECFEKQENFEMYGELYKRPLRPGLPEGIEKWYQRKEIYFMCVRDADKSLFSPELAGAVAADFFSIVPIYEFMWKAKGD